MFKKHLMLLLISLSFFIYSIPVMAAGTISATFLRASTAYKLDGTSVANGVPRFETGHSGQGLMLEEGTVNVIPKPNPTQLSDVNYSTGVTFNNGLHIPGGTGEAQIVCQQPSALSANLIYSFGLNVKMDDNSAPDIQLSNSSGDAVLIVHDSYAESIKPLSALDNNVYRVTGTYTNGSSSEYSTTGLFKYAGNSSKGMTVVGNWQLEQKPYATSFTDSTRSDETLKLPTSGVINSSAGTIEAWVKLSVPAGSSVNHRIFNMGDSTNGLSCYVNGSGCLEYDFGSVSQSSIIDSDIFPQNQWTHVAVTWSNGEYKLYKNGQLIGSAAGNLTDLSSISNVNLGSNSLSSEQFDGIFDDFSTYNRVLTDSEINASYTSGTIANDCIVNMPFDGDLSLAIYNSTPAADDGTISTTFSRASTAYKLDGTSVANGVPRFETGYSGQGLMLEESTVNVIPKPNPTQLSDVYYSTGVTFNNGLHIPGGTGQIQLVCQQPSALSVNAIYSFGLNVKMDDNSAPDIQLSNSSGDAVLIIHDSYAESLKPLSALDNNVYRVTGTYTNGSSSEYATTGLFKYAGNSSKGMTVVGNWQLEKKPYATSFTDSTRLAETLKLPTSGVINSSAGTIEAWVKLSVPTGSSVNHRIFNIGDSTNGISCYVNGSGYLEYDFGYESQSSIIDSDIFPQNQWIHVVVTWSNGTYKLYKNGQLVGSAAGTLADLSSISNINLGSNSWGSEQFDGIFDDFHIYNRNLTDSEINASYTGGTIANGCIINMSFDGDFSLDSTSPTAPSINFTSPDGYTSGSWTNQDVTFTLTDGTDTGTGVQKSVYSLDNGSTWNDYSAGVTISSPGTTTVLAKTIDKASNESTNANAAINIDKTAPIITILPYSTSNTNQNITVTASTNEGTLNAASHTFTSNGSFTFIATDDASNSSSQTVTITNICKDSPVGGFSINGGALITNNPTVTLSVYGNDINGIDSMAISNSSYFDPDSWETFAQNKTWSLTSGDGVKQVHMKLKNALGTESNEYITDITLYTSNPDGSIAINNGAAATNNKNVFLTIDAEPITVTTSVYDTVAGDVYSTFTSNIFQIMLSNTATFDGAAWEAYNASKNWVLPDGDGPKTVYIKFKDIFENESQPYTDSIVLDTTPPSGSVTVNSGASTTNNQIVALNINATDSTGISQMMISNDASFTGAEWQDYYTNPSWTLISGDGTKIIYAKFKDSVGNISPIYTATIKLITSSSNGSSGSSGSSSNMSQHEIISELASKLADDILKKLDVEKSGDITTAKLQAIIEGEISKLTVTDEMAQKILATGTTDSNKDKSKVVLEVQSKSDTDIVQITMPASMLSEAKEKGISKLNMSLGIASVEISPDTIDTNNAEEVSIIIKKIKDKDLQDSQKQVVGNDPVYDISAQLNKNDGTTQQVHKLNGDIQINIPYILKAGDDPDKITVFFVDDKGNLENKCGKYDAETKSVVFMTDHFSKYVIRQNVMNYRDIKDETEKRKVEILAAKGIIAGRTKDLFAPNKPISRAELVALLVRILKLGDETAVTTFKDVKKEKWYYHEVASAQKLGLISGYKNGIFNPGGDIKKKDAAVIIAKAIKIYNTRHLPADSKSIKIKLSGDINKFASRLEVADIIYEVFIEN